MIVKNIGNKMLSGAFEITLLETSRPVDGKGEKMTVKQAKELVATGNYMIRVYEKGYFSLPKMTNRYTDEYVVELFPKKNDDLQPAGIRLVGFGK